MSIRTATVLIVDDSKLERQHCIRAIQEELAPAVRAIAVPNFKKAEEVLSQEVIEAVVLDLVLQQQDPQGFDAIVRTRELCSAPIIVHSGSNLPRIRRLAEIGGVIAYVEKQDNRNQLVGEVAKAIGTRRQSQSEQYDVRQQLGEIKTTVEENSKTQREMRDDLKKQNVRIEALEDTVNGNREQIGLKQHCKRRTQLHNRLGWALLLAFLSGVTGIVVANFSN